MTWQPIETAPKDGTQVLLWRDETIVGRWQIDDRRPYWTGGDIYWRGVRWCRDHNPTHWQPLPEPPVTP